MLDFSTLQAVIMDMDGVLWRGDEPLPGMQAFFAHLRERHIPFVLATNNSSKHPSDYVQKLARMGVDGIEERQIVSSATATADYLAGHYPRGSAVHVLGGGGLKTLITDVGFTLADEAEIVVVGIDFDVNYEKLKRAAYLIRAGADFIGTNADRTFPMPDGLAPGAGSLLALLEAATDRAPLVIGKPHAPMFEAALHVLGTDAVHTLMIGDRLDTDIAGAQRVGMRTALTLTGVSQREHLSESGVVPDAVFDDLVTLAAAWFPA